MNMKKLACLLLVLLMVFSCIGVGLAGEINPCASSIFIKASVTINDSMTATFSTSTYQSTTISVSSCSLQKKVGGVWKSAGSLTAPPSGSGTSYDKSKDYSGSCSSGTTYRVVATFKAGTETKTKYSNEITY